jgi:hypothetical protein
MNRMRFATGLALAIAVVGATPAVAASKGDALDGVYRISWTEKEAIAAGAPFVSAHADFGFARGRQVIVTITLRGGRFSLRDTSARRLCTGGYTGSAGTDTINETAHCSGLVIASWSLSGGRLHLHVTKATDPGDMVVFGAKPWKKIG